MWTFRWFASFFTAFSMQKHFIVHDTYLYTGNWRLSCSSTRESASITHLFFSFRNPLFYPDFPSSRGQLSSSAMFFPHAAKVFACASYKWYANHSDLTFVSIDAASHSNDLSSQLFNLGGHLFCTTTCNWIYWIWISESRFIFSNRRLYSCTHNCTLLLLKLCANQHFTSAVADGFVFNRFPYGFSLKIEDGALQRTVSSLNWPSF